ASGSASATAALGAVAATDTLVITALGDKQVMYHAYSGPNATNAPFNKKNITRRYSFGGTQGQVTIGGASVTISQWSDTEVRVTAPSRGGVTGVPACTQQRGVTGSVYCGQLEITRADGKKSVDTVVVTIGGKMPVYVTPDSPSVSTFGHIQPNPLQTAIDQ